MAYTEIDDPEAYFQVKTYTGDGSTQAITFDGDTDMQPDLVWVKNRSEDYEHTLFDSVRGVQKFIRSSTTGTEQTNANTLTAFGSDGFSVGSDGSVNDNTDGFVAWCWKANGSGSSNTAGSINTTATSANTTAGISIVTWTGDEGSSATLGHGLGAVPKMIITKGRTYASSWATYHASLGATKVMYLSETDASADVATIWNDTEPTSTLFTVGSSNQVNDAYNYVAYVFAEKQGFSKFGSYTGNGDDADGTFVYTGFKPSFVLVKKTSGTDDWTLSDHKRDVDVSPNFARLAANTTAVESENIIWARINKFSNGFRPGGTDSVTNESGSTYIYMAFAEAPFVNSNGVPCNAR
jgi:hypothetical protein